jgi:multidrug efflux system membrane fusion protein
MKDRVFQGRTGKGEAWRGPRWAFFALLVLLIAFLAVLNFLESRKAPRQEETEGAAPAMPVQPVGIENPASVVRGQGVVTPRVEVDLMPEVAGRVVFMHSELHAGGVIRAGEKIVQIDPRDSELAVQEAQAAVAEAQASLDLRTSEEEAMRRLNPQEEPNVLQVLGVPQRQQARAALDAAKARLALAELQLERTTLSLPFDALIVAKGVDLGQYVTAGQTLAKAYGIETFEVEVPLADGDLARLDRPETLLPAGGGARQAEPVPAVVKATFAGREYTWQGRVVGTTGQADEATGTIAVVVEVPGPFETDDGRPPLLPGTTVEILFTGELPEGAGPGPEPPDS